MKKFLILFLVLGTFSCSDPFEDIDPSTTVVPDNLVILETSGLKLDKWIVTDEVSINTKLPSNGTYKLRILDIGNELVSQEKIDAKEGDNILKIYVGSLPISSYTIELRTEDNQLLGSEVFVML